MAHRLTARLANEASAPVAVDVVADADVAVAQDAMRQLPLRKHANGAVK